MTDSLPAPLTPPECDLRDFAFMPLDVVRLRDSDLSATPDAEVFRAAVLSWCASWHQIPAASLPDDDAVISRLIGMGRDVRGFRKLRESGAMRGFVKCSDGRLYHSVVAEKANEAWQRKCSYQSFRDSQSQKGKIGAAKRWSSKNGGTGHNTGHEKASPENSLKKQVQGQGQEEKQDTSLRSAAPLKVSKPRTAHPKTEPEGFSEFYLAYPRKEARPSAAKAYAAALTRAKPEALLDGAKRYALSRADEDPKFTKHPATWLNNDCWMDQEVSHETSIDRGRGRAASGARTFIDAGASLINELRAEARFAESGDDNPLAIEAGRPLLPG